MAGELNQLYSSQIATDIGIPNSGDVCSFSRQWIPPTPILCNNSYTSTVQILANQLLVWDNGSSKSLMQIQSNLNSGSAQITTVPFADAAPKSLTQNSWNNNPTNQSQSYTMIMDNEMIYTVQANWGQMGSPLPTNFFTNPPTNNGVYIVPHSLLRP